MSRNVSVVEKVHSANDQLAAENQERLQRANLFSINLMASPGAGKTSLIEKTLAGLDPALEVAALLQERPQFKSILVDNAISMHRCYGVH
jgi:hydrogenase nickel incorporation protein HypB